MVRLNRKQRSALSDTARQVGNLTFGALVLGQFVGNRPVSWGLIASGGIASIALAMMGILLLAGEE